MYDRVSFLLMGIMIGLLIALGLSEVFPIQHGNTQHINYVEETSWWKNLTSEPAPAEEIVIHKDGKKFLYSLEGEYKKEESPIASIKEWWDNATEKTAKGMAVLTVEIERKVQSLYN